MNTTKISAILVVALGLLVWSATVSEAAPMGTAFTYQGRIIDANEAADGLYDFQFKLLDDPCSGTQQGSTVGENDLDVIDGYFTVELDFGSDVFDGDVRWLEVGVRPGDSNDPNAFVSLIPRQEITPVPYALQTRGIFVDNSGNVGIGTISPSLKLDVVGGAAISGNVGIGTTNPSTKFHLDGQSLWLTGGNGGGFPPSAGAGLRLFHDGSTAHIWAHDYQAQQPTDMIFQAPGGNVGIGTINPSQKLDVAGGATISGNVGIGTGNPTSPLTVNGIIESTIGGVKFPDGTNQTSASTGDGHSLDAADGSPTDALYVDNAGNVGIGTLGPQEKLEINGKLGLKGATYSTVLSDDGGALMIDTSRSATVAQMRLLPYDNDMWIQNTNSGGDICFSGFAGEDLTGDIILKTAGNVGIGTSSPTAKLDVEGNVDISGNRVKNYRGFPRPDYDSGWKSIGQGDLITLTHSLGGNVDNYVVDMQSKDTGWMGINNVGHGGDRSGINFYGVEWHDLTTSEIGVWRHSDNDETDYVRIRIWVYD